MARALHAILSKVNVMPTYEFRCRNCDASFERTLHVNEYELVRARGVECPKCASKNIVPQITEFEVKTSRRAS